MQKQYDLAVFIGRFQIAHVAHLETISRASNLADRVLVIIGGEGRARNFHNPFTTNERKELMRAACKEWGIHNVIARAARDHMYNDVKWATGIRDIVYEEVQYADSPKICLVGAKKDDTSFYLDMFPEWHSELTPIMGSQFDATYLRENMYNVGYIAAWRNEIVDPIPHLINEWIDKNPDIFQNLRDEFNFVTKYREAWKAAPYAPTFVTVDAVVECCGHVLVVERGAQPGKGQIALPGGFLNQNETTEVACIRELREETGIKVPAPVLRGNIKSRDVFDHPRRSLRGRTVTHAFHIQLPDTKLPKVKGADDASKAWWIPINEFMDRSDEVYEDHYFIVEKMLGV